MRQIIPVVTLYIKFTSRVGQFDRFYREFTRENHVSVSQIRYFQNWSLVSFFSFFQRARNHRILANPIVTLTSHHIRRSRRVHIHHIPPIPTRLTRVRALVHVATAIATLNTLLTHITLQILVRVAKKENINSQII